jgi:glycosyltransferase involved in cell wall biosynthesis
MPERAPTVSRVLLVGRSRYAYPFEGADAAKFAGLGDKVDWHLLARGRRSHADERVTLIGPAAAFDAIAFHARLLVEAIRLLRRRRPQVIVAQDPFLGAILLGLRRLVAPGAAVVVEVHGDWGAATRLYGSSGRRLLSGVVEPVARYGLRHADAVRAITEYTASLARGVRGRDVDAVFPTYLDLDDFTATPPVPLPEEPVAVFVGVLERYKNIDRLLSAWSSVRDRVPGARLRIVGNGSMRPLVDQAVAADETLSYDEHLGRPELAEAFDASWGLVLPSRSEGMGRVVVEAVARARPVVGARVGGIPELVQDGENGLLVDPSDEGAIADALVRLLGDRAFAEQLAADAARRAESLRAGPDAWVDAFLGLVETAAARRPS